MPIPRQALLAVLGVAACSPSSGLPPLAVSTGVVGSGGGSETDTDSGGADTGPVVECTDGDANACDDGDACTTDACEGGTCTHSGLPASPADLFDLATLTDPSTLDLEILSTTTVWEGETAVAVSEIRYTSTESEACAQSPIRIQAFIAVPAGATSPLPGLVIAHGLGGSGTAETAAAPAAAYGVVTLAYSGPGEGLSEGTPSTPDHLFDTVDSPRDSWLWEHAVAAIRGLTVLSGWEGVDPDRLAMTGSSAGGLATLLVNGVDDRLSAAIPVSATGYMDLAVAATPTPGWEVDLLAAMNPPTTIDDPAWTAFETWLDPKHFLRSAHGDTLIIDGAQDEFFPITSAVATFDDLSAAGNPVRILHIQDWDHVYYPADAADVLIEDATRTWLGHTSGTDTAFSLDPPQPEISVSMCTESDSPDCTMVSVDPGGTYSPISASFHWSADGITWQSNDLIPDDTTGLWGGEITSLDGESVRFATVTYETTMGQDFTLSTPANIPVGFPLEILPDGGG